MGAIIDKERAKLLEKKKKLSEEYDLAQEVFWENETQRNRTKLERIKLELQEINTVLSALNVEEINYPKRMVEHNELIETYDKLYRTTLDFLNGVDFDLRKNKLNIEALQNSVQRILYELKNRKLFEKWEF